jgi:trehalose 6-phosphate synthase/phosphatase
MSAARRPSGGLIIVSNRLPVVLTPDPDGGWHVESGSGGLVSALAPVLRDRGGVWIGWTGAVAEDAVDEATILGDLAPDAGYRLKPIPLTAQERLDYYQGFSNETIWPLFHDLPSRASFVPNYWLTYRAVNRKFARAIARAMRDDDVVGVHDYHLMGVARELRALGVRKRLHFFLHIPFPPLDILLKLPWRSELLDDLLEYDLIGFQTLRDRRNFIQCVRTLSGESGIDVQGRGSVVRLRRGPRELLVGAFPIGVDAHQFSQDARDDGVAEAAGRMHEQLRQQQIMLGVDRLDYTKGVPEKLRAFREALFRYPELHARIVLVQVLVPSRGEIPQYSSLKAEIEQLVGEINGEFTQPGWAPLHYIHRSLPYQDLLAFYRAADILIATPWKDGMNLVAKEYCACQVDERGVLILSEFAGAAAQLHRNARVVNPHDLDGVAAAIREAFHMSVETRRARMRRLRQEVQRHDVFWWVDTFLQTAASRRLDSFPVLEDYVPGRHPATHG